MFDKVITPEFKKIFKDSIDTILAQGGLTVSCTIEYENTLRDLCYNCEFDPINQRSANVPKSTAVVNFPHQSICPVCNGFGYVDTAKDEKVNLAVIFDHKYFLNWGSNAINVPEGTIQTICSISLLPKIKEAKNLIVDSTLANYGNYHYVRAGDPEPAGLGNNDYIVTLWNKS